MIKKTGLEPTEFQIQKALISFCNTHKKLETIWHSNNSIRVKTSEGGHVQGKILKEMGVRRGVPDLTLAYANHGYHGLFLELKSISGDLSKEQLQFFDIHAARGYLCACVKHEWTEAKDLLLWYVGDNKDFKLGKHTTIHNPDPLPINNCYNFFI